MESICAQSLLLWITSLFSLFKHIRDALLFPSEDLHLLFELIQQVGLGLTGFVIYTCAILILVLVLIFRYVPRYGQTHMVVYIGICSLMGSLTVGLFSLFFYPSQFRGLSIPNVKHFLYLLSLVSLFLVQVMFVKAVGIALKLSFSGSNQFKYFETWFFTFFVILCCLVQLNYLNKVIRGFIWKHFGIWTYR